MSSALWWVTNGRAAAPPAIGCIIGVSTSMKSRAVKNVAQVLDDLRRGGGRSSRTSSLAIRST